MNYDPNKYRALGVGERIKSSHFIIMKDGDFGTEPTPVSAAAGCLVEADDTGLYIEQLPTAVIPKDTYPTGAARSAAEGRGRFDLIPYEAMLSLAKRYEMGAKMFGDSNWLKGMPLSRILSSMRRHASQINYDFTEDHVGAVLWNAAAFVTMVERMRVGILPKELDDIGYFIGEGGGK